MQPRDQERQTFENQPDGKYAQRVVVVPAQYTENAYKHYNTSGTRTIKTGKGKLINLSVNRAVSLGQITVYDALDATDPNKIIAEITHPLTLLQSAYVLNYALDFQTGLTVKTSTTDDITIGYR